MPRDVTLARLLARPGGARYTVREIRAARVRLLRAGGVLRLAFPWVQLRTQTERATKGN